VPRCAPRQTCLVGAAGFASEDLRIADDANATVWMASIERCLALPLVSS
jgi:hypothetical protein